MSDGPVLVKRGKPGSHLFFTAVVGMIRPFRNNGRLWLCGSKGSDEVSNWAMALGSIVAALVVAGGMAWAGSDNGTVYQGIPVMLWCVALAFGVQWLVFVHAWARRTERYYDLTGSVTYMVVVAFALLASGADSLRAWLLGALIVIWSARLGTFLYRRISSTGEDRRFRTLKQSFPLFLMTWTLQGTWVFVTASCALAAITAVSSVPLNLTFGVGVLLWIIGFGVEVAADAQKSRFRADPDNADDFIASGLWGWSRHPNYFGEIVLWCGIAIMAYPVLLGAQVITLLAPLFVILQLTLISGVRMLEARADRRWGEDPAYQAYKRRTPVLMLWPPARRS